MKICPVSQSLFYMALSYKEMQKDTFQSANRRALLFNTCLLSSFAED